MYGSYKISYHYAGGGGARETQKLNQNLKPQLFHI